MRRIETWQVVALPAAAIHEKVLIVVGDGVHRLAAQDADTVGLLPHLVVAAIIEHLLLEGREQIDGNVHDDGVVTTRSTTPSMRSNSATNSLNFSTVRISLRDR